MGVVVALMAAAYLALTSDAADATYDMLRQPHLDQRDDRCAIHNWRTDYAAAYDASAARERCFCAYAELTSRRHSRERTTPRQLQSLTRACPSWPRYVSSDGGASPNLLSHTPRATILGSAAGSIADWAVDLGGGYDASCVAPCKPVGAHLLSIPRRAYLRDCCTSGALSLAYLDARELCPLLNDMVAGALAQMPQPQRLRSCNMVGEEPTLANGCLSQCFHIKPDVLYVHLHTTAGVFAIRSGPGNAGLGPGFNASEAADAHSAYGGRYNVCACEPAEWAGARRGSCPTVEPASEAYAAQAARSLCENLMGVVGRERSLCDVCAVLE